MSIIKEVRIFKISDSNCIVIPKRIVDRARLNIHDKLILSYDDEVEDTITIKIKKYGIGNNNE